MKKDIQFPKVEEVGVAIVPSVKEGTKFWQAHIINFGKEPISTVLISSKGCGTIDGREKETAVMRHMIDRLEGESSQSFEGLIEDLTALTNQFWVSYYKNNKLYDKKFVFVAESISDKNLMEIPILDSKGVLIQ